MARKDGKAVAALSQSDQPPHWNCYVTVATADDAAAQAKELGGQLLAEPFDVFDAGRMAVVQDPTGAALAVWQPGTSIGAELVNVPGAMTWADVITSDSRPPSGSTPTGSGGGSRRSRTPAATTSSSTVSAPTAACSRCVPRWGRTRRRTGCPTSAPTDRGGERTRRGERRQRPARAGSHAQRRLRHRRRPAGRRQRAVGGRLRRLTPGNRRGAILRRDAGRSRRAAHADRRRARGGGAARRRGHDPPRRRRARRTSRRRPGRAWATATPARTPRTTSASSPTCTSRSAPSARATSAPTATYAMRNTDTTPNNLDSDLYWAQGRSRTRTVEELLAAPDGPGRRGRAGRARLHRGLQRLHPREGAAAQGPALRRRAVGQADRGDRRLPPLPPARAAGLADGRARRDRRGPAADARAARPTRARARARGRATPDLDERSTARSAAARTPSRSAATRPTTAAGCCSATRTSRGTTPSASTRRTLTLPGRLDVAGASLYGVPAVNIGYTKDLAWSHTVSTARRFVIVELQLVPGSPTTYLVDGQPKEMKRTTVTVAGQGRAPDVTRTLYSTDFGPVTTSLAGAADLPVDAGAGVRDVRRQRRQLRPPAQPLLRGQPRAVGRASCDAILKRHRGIPWVNTIAADREGDAYYADIGAIPDVPDAKIADCSTPLGTALDSNVRVQVLDGTRSACAPGGDPARRPQMPELLRDDYTENSNDSYWLSNARHADRGLRADHRRGAHRPLAAHADGASRSSRTSSRRRARSACAALQDAMFNNRVKLGELWRDELVAMCRAEPGVPAEACDALERWSGRDDVGANGGALFRRFADRAIAANASPFRVAVRPQRPGRHAERARHDEPGGQAGAARRDRRPAGAGPAARRAASARSSTRRAASASRCTAAPTASGSSTSSTPSSTRSRATPT